MPHIPRLSDWLKGRKKKPTKLTVNDAQRVMVQCSSLVDRNAVRRETRNGVEHIIISSKTLPDDIVMNQGLYPADEIAKSFMGLEGTLAPLEHPTDANGNYISANDANAINFFHVGAYNENVRRENGRVLIDKVINVNTAKQTEKGRELLARVEELETNSDPRPIHTSVGVVLIREPVKGMQANDSGQQYSWVARQMTFDHDAILLSNPGAAQPHQGVGMAVNEEGSTLEVQQVELSESDETGDLVTVPASDIEEVSHEELRDKLLEALNVPPLSADWIVRVFDSRVIYELNEKLFSVPYTVGNDVITITGLPQPVDREERFTPTTNHKQEGDPMYKEFILNALAKAGIETEGLSDEQAVAKYKTLQANSQDDKPPAADDTDQASLIANAVTEGLKPLREEIDSLKGQLTANADAELTKLAEMVGNSDKYPGIDADAAKKLGLDTLKTMAANCGTAFAVPAGNFQTNNHDNAGGLDGMEMAE